MACPLSYNLSITGDCTNSNLGAFNIDILGSAPDFTLTWISPSGGTSVAITAPYNYSISGLSAGTYSFVITDSCVTPTTTELVVNVYVSSGTCVNIDAVESTLCGLDNGSLTATTSNFYGNAEFYLYETTDGYITSASSLSNSYIFSTLSAGTYYVVANDGGGCTGKSETCIVKSSSTLTYGFYTVDDAGCATNSGAIYVTGLTGNPPYTYLWSNGGTLSYITGLTAGLYSVTVTDNTGCAQTNSVTISSVAPVGFGSFSSISPTCFNSDGELTINVTGGTAPFYYSGSNGVSVVTFSPSYTFTGLGSGFFSVTVTDAGLCSFTQTTTLLSPNSYSILSVNVSNSTCNNSGGSITISLFGTSSTYTYTLTDTSGNTYNIVTSSFSTAFNSLPSGTYTLSISNSSDVPCVYTGTYVVENTVLFELTVETTGTTCNSNDGSVTLMITDGGTPPYTYAIDGFWAIDSNTAYTFTNLVSGNYTATVTDSTYCAQTLPFIIPASSSINFTLVGTNLLYGGDGTVSAYITEGEPPFSLTWSPNANGQTGLTITSLSAGTYTLTITDDNGCTQTRSVTIYGLSSVNSYQVYNVCDTDFQNTGILAKKGPQQMLIEGFHDLTLNDLNCILNQAIFSAQITINGNTTLTPFYTGTTLSDYPSNDLWYDILQETISSYEGIKEVIINSDKNELIIITVCGNNLIDFNNSAVIVNLVISYDISCVECDVPTITPTPTSTVTPTPTPTITPTPTPTPCVANCYEVVVEVTELQRPVYYSECPLGINIIIYTTGGTLYICSANIPTGPTVMSATIISSNCLDCTPG